MLDAGRLTDAHGRTVDFRHAIVIMTSNIGAERILAAEDLEDVREAVLTEARSRLRPELVGRVDEVVLFARLTRTELRRIVGLLLEETRERLSAKGVALVVDDAAADLLAGLGSRPELGLARYGARSAKRWSGAWPGCCWRASSCPATPCTSRPSTVSWPCAVASATTHDPG